ncbi:MAG: acetylxylan esterase [Candidatus Aenigmarchaeota archaeon]|nr:acetylxylan esterase [Candidatus Aenigmarchaeota archaeon]
MKKHKTPFAVIIALIVITGAYYFLSLEKPSQEWSLAHDGTFSYPENRGLVEYEEIILNDTAEFRLSKIIYVSKGEKIYALLRVPKTGSKAPAMVMLPGALVTKEGQQRIAEFFQRNGIATLTLDERGNGGETQGGMTGMEAEHTSYLNGVAPVPHRMVFDALRAFDILQGRDEIDPEKIGFYGESMGGRFAIIAAALEPRAKFLIGVSTSGYGSLKQRFDDEGVARFYASIDPDSYVGRISPRNVVLVHATNDPMVPLEMAKSTYYYANKPKLFIEVNSTCHGLCDEMKAQLMAELDCIL